MAKVKKRNRVLTVNDQSVASYLKEGYDQVDDKGKILKPATGGKSVTLKEYNAALQKIKELEANQADAGLAEQLEEVKKENTALKGKVTKLENAAKEQDSEKDKK